MPRSFSAPRPERPLRSVPRLGAVAAIILALAGIGSAGWWLGSALQVPGPLPEARAIVVPRGTTTQLARALTAEGVIGQPVAFRAAAWLSSGAGALHAAEFTFPAHASIRQVLAILRTAKPVEHRVTIAEGLTAHQIAGVLDRAEAMSGEVRGLDEGSILPQTYDYEYGTERAAIVARAKLAMDKALAAAWAERAADLPLATPREALILASIVERETAKPEERGHVAAVYLNRMKLGMRLQADPTVVYLASGGSGVLDHPLTRRELALDSPFNTYRNAGLPPGPICSPGSESLHAVLRPADSDDLYFVADGTGAHVFSRSYTEHDSAVTRRRAMLPSGAGGAPD